MKNLINSKLVILFVIYFLVESNVAFTQNYCIPVYTIGTSWLNGSYTNNDYLQSVQLTGNYAPGINCNLNCCGPNIPPWNGGPAPFSVHPPDYEIMIDTTTDPLGGLMHPNVVAKLTSNLVYPITYQCGTRFDSNFVAGFIDYNHDGDFYDTINGIPEKIFQSLNMTSSQINNTNFLVPYLADTGCTILRVREVRGISNIDPCATYAYGETEDYTVCITKGTNVGIIKNQNESFQFFSIENTANNSIDLVFYSDKTEPVRYSVFDIAGRMILNGVVKKVQSGINRISLNHDVVKGIYFVKLQNNSGAIAKKVFRN